MTTGDGMSKIRDEFDVIIVGGGPAGLSAGIVASYKGLKAAVFEGGTWGGLLSTIYPKKKIHNYPGVPAIRAGYLAAEWVRQAADNGVHIIKARIVKIHPDLRVETELGDFYSAKSIIIATGTRPNELGIPGEARLSKRDKGVYPYVTDPESFRDKKVLVIGGGDTAIDAVLDLSNVAKKIFLAHRKKDFRASEMNVEKIKREKLAEIITGVTIKEIIGKTKVDGAVLENMVTGDKIILDIDRVILAVGLVPNQEIYASLGLEISGKFLKTDEMMRTNIKGVFAAGDLVAPYQLATVAAAQGALAAHAAYIYIKDPYWKKDHQKEEITVKEKQFPLELALEKVMGAF